MPSRTTKPFLPTDASGRIALALISLFVGGLAIIGLTIMVLDWHPYGFKDWALNFVFSEMLLAIAILAGLGLVWAVRKPERLKRVIWRRASVVGLALGIFVFVPMLALFVRQLLEWLA